MIHLFLTFFKKLYRIDNYPDIYQFAEDNFKISKGSCSEFLNISKKFFEKSEDLIGSFMASVSHVSRSYPNFIILQYPPQQFGIWRVVFGLLYHQMPVMPIATRIITCPSYGFYSQSIQNIMIVWFLGFYIIKCP